MSKDISGLMEAANRWGQFTPTAINDNSLNPAVWGYYDNGYEQGKQYQYWSYDENGDITHSTMHPHEESMYISHPAGGSGIEISNDENNLFVDVSDLAEEETLEQAIEDIELEF
ncbi:hypothetical protein FACS1894219_04440 [Clostridia bacterium]|nr:hypothetical protein FACS1894219_04440 [Clostridia bacterium]